MLRADDRALVDAARSVADGAPVDWASAESRADADNRRLVSHLRLVESIASLHRSIPAFEPEDSESLPRVGTADSTLGSVPGSPHWGRLSLLERIGQGTSCEVYRAWDTALHREVALKLLHDEGDRRDAHGRLLEEARRLARVRHAHVVQVYGAEQHDGRVGLWMELVRGESLEQTVQTRGTFGSREAALIGLDLCAALAAVHGAGLLHRDIKAQNVMRESGGRLVLMDFGTGEELSGTNRLVGTPLYLAPEIFRGQRASVQSDLYSLGVLLFYLVTGRFPVSAGSMEQLARAHAHRERQPLRDLRPDMPEAFVAAVERALDSDPARRYQSVGDFESALRESLDGRRPAVAVSTRATPRRRFGLAFVSAVAALALAVVALIVWTRATQSNRGTVLSAIRSIAVLPMSEVAGSGLPKHVASGLTDEIIASLGQIHALSVKSGLSVKALKELPPKEIADRLGVDAWLETTLSAGSQSPSGGDGVRVRANLIAAGTQTVVWTKLFERPRGQLLSLHTDIAKAVATALNVLTPLEAGRLASVPQRNPAAEEAYLLGRMHIDRYGAGSADLALKAFERAVRLDPTNASAHAGAAWAYVSLGQNGAIGNAQARAQAMAEVRRALELDEGLAEAHTILGHVYFIYEWDWAAADRAFRHSIDLNPNSAVTRTYYADYLEAMGRFDDALVHAEMAKRLEPESSAAARRYALALYYKRDFAAAEQALREAEAMDPHAAGAILEGRLDEALGRMDAALAATTRAVQLSGGGGVPLRVGVIRLEALTGQRAQALEDLQQLEREADRRAIRLTARDVAYVKLALNDTDGALTAFERAVEDRDPSVVWLAVDPRLDALRHVERFRRVLERIGLPHRP